MKINFYERRNPKLLILVVCALALFSLYVPFNSSIAYMYQITTIMFIILFCGDSIVTITTLFILLTARSYISGSISASFEQHYSINNLMLVICIVCIVFLTVIKRGYTIQKSGIKAAWAFFGLLFFLTQLWAEYSIEYQQIGLFESICLMYLFVPMLVNEDIDWFYFELTFLLAGLYLAIGIIPHLRLYGTIYQYAVIGDRNYQAGVLVLCIMQTLELLISSRHRLNLIIKILSLIVIMADFYILVVGASRSGFIAVAIGVVLYFLLNKNIKSGIVYAVIFAIGIMFAWEMGLFDKILERFELAEVASGNGRLEKWQYYFQLFSEGNIFYTIFGRGLVGLQYVGGVAHNTFVSVLFSTGIVGVGLLLGAIIISTVRIMNSDYRNELIVIIPFVFMCCTLDLYYRTEFVLFLGSVVGLASKSTIKKSINGFYLPEDCFPLI